LENCQGVGVGEKGGVLGGQSSGLKKKKTKFKGGKGKGGRKSGKGPTFNGGGKKPDSSGGRGHVRGAHQDYSQRNPDGSNVSE